MRRPIAREQGMSLVEATIILAVLALLTSVLAPAMGDYVADARQTKAKEDVEALGMGVVRLLRDTGAPFPTRNPAGTRQASNRVDLLVSEGGVPTESAGALGTVQNGTTYFVDADVKWVDAVVAGGAVELATDHLVTNAKNYTVVTFTAPVAGGPRPGLGWRGGYISTSTGPDPWGNRYACTTVWINPSSDSVEKGTPNDAFCLTAGADGNVDTDMDSVNGGARVLGDDLAYVIQGTTR